MAYLGEYFPIIRLYALSKTAFLFFLGWWFTSGPGLVKVLPALIVTILLWLVLYVLNEVFDLEQEDNKRIPLGTKFGLFTGMLTLLAIGIGLSFQLGLPLAMMVLLEFAYFLPQLRMKSYWWYAVILTGILNPFFRIAAGSAYGTSQFPAVLYLIILAIHLAHAIGNRFNQCERDQRLGYFVVPRWMRSLGLAFHLWAIGGWIYFVRINHYPIALAWWVFFSIGFVIWFWLHKEGDPVSEKKLSRLKYLFPYMDWLIYKVPKKNIRRYWWVMAIFFGYLTLRITVHLPFDFP